MFCFQYVVTKKLLQIILTFFAETCYRSSLFSMKTDILYKSKEILIEQNQNAR